MGWERATSHCVAQAQWDFICTQKKEKALILKLSSMPYPTHELFPQSSLPDIKREETEN